MAGFALSFSNISFASEQPSTIKQKLRDQVSYELKVIQQSLKGPPPEFASPTILMTPKEWKQILNEQQRQLANLLALINKTPEEQLPDVLVSLFLEEQKYINKYSPLEPYMLAMGERIIPPFTEQYDQAAPRTRERILMILGNIHSRKALPLVRKALDDPNQRVILHAQTALRLILQLEAKPELEKMLMTTKSSWALKHTLREISLTGGKDWYEEFFRLAKSRKILLQDLALIGAPEDCPEEVIGDNLDFFMKIITSDNEPEIHPSDIYSLAEFLSFLKREDDRTSILINDVISNFEPQLLESLNKIGDATELTGQDEEAIIFVFNKTKDNLGLYPKNASTIELKNPVLKDMLKDLIERRIFINTAADNWRVKDSLSAEEQESIEWFNIYLLNQEFPLVLSKDKYGNNERDVARRMLLKLHKQIYLRQLYPLITEILHDRYGWGGKIEGFTSGVMQASNQFSGFRDDEADLLLKNIASNLHVEDIEEWLKRDSSDFLTRLFLQDLLAQQNGASLDLNEKVFSFRIEAIDQFNNSLASSVFQLKYGQEQNIVLPSQNTNFSDHNIKLKVQLDRDKWLFHIDPILIDLKPYGAGFDIYIPIAGINETFLTETFAGQKEKINWRFEHIDKSD